MTTIIFIILGLLAFALLWWMVFALFSGHPSKKPRYVDFAYDDSLSKERKYFGDAGRWIINSLNGMARSQKETVRLMSEKMDLLQARIDNS